MEMEVEVLYHGTKFKKTADKILKEGFERYSYFAKDLNTAIHQGGKYVFEVVFLKNKIPDYWQVRCMNKISHQRIQKLTKYSVQNIFTDKRLQVLVFYNALDFQYLMPYTFKETIEEQNNINEIIQCKKSN